MLPTYNLSVDITATDAKIDEETFRAEVSQCLTYLSALKGAFDREPCSITYYPPDAQHHKPEYWSVRALMMISVGKKRAGYLIQLYEAIVRLIRLELPHLKVEAEISEFRFS